jgi:O-antigen/teichoic acid export membrane protein
MDVVAFALVYLVSGAAVLAYNIIVVLLSYSRPMPRFDFGMWKSLIIGGLPFCLSSLFYFLFFSIDIQLIDMMKGDAAVGNYSAAFRLIQAVLVLPSMATTVLFPVVSEYFHRNNPNLTLLLEKSIKYLLIIGAPIAVGTIILSDKFILLLYHSDYMPAIGVLQVLCIGMMFIYLNSVPSLMLSATNMQKVYMIICFIAAAFNITANILVIPAYGIVGSAYVMVATQGLILVLLSYFFVKSGYKLPHLTDVIKISACTLLMGAFVYVAHEYNLLVIVILAAVIYSVLIVVTRSVSGDDYKLMASIFAKKDAHSN